MFVTSTFLTARSRSHELPFVVFMPGTAGISNLRQRDRELSSETCGKGGRHDSALSCCEERDAYHSALPWPTLTTSLTLHDIFSPAPFTWLKSASYSPKDAATTCARSKMLL